VSNRKRLLTVYDRNGAKKYPLRFAVRVATPSRWERSISTARCRAGSESPYMTDESRTSKYVIHCESYSIGASACRGVLSTPGCFCLGEKLQNCENHE
jgi:hypothetical protein